MKTMTGFYITGLTLQGFRNQVTSVHFDCGSMTLISGHNGTGKTTMAHAICYALYGANFYGEQKI
ncbi:MAG: AAA family ATPase, partial [Clostridia bacterium]|nr:AAA family ATPase [Clostridia bacterium]